MAHDTDDAQTASTFIGFTPGPFDRFNVSASESRLHAKPQIELRIEAPIGIGPDRKVDYLRTLTLQLTRAQAVTLFQYLSDVLHQYDALVPIIEQKREVEQRGRELK